VVDRARLESALLASRRRAPQLQIMLVACPRFNKRERRTAGFATSQDLYALCMLNSRSWLFSIDSSDCASVRDRGVGGSNPLAPTNSRFHERPDFLRNLASLLFHPPSFRKAGGSLGSLPSDRRFKSAVPPFRAPRNGRDSALAATRAGSSPRLYPSRSLPLRYPMLRARDRLNAEANRTS
jgi:hypothetical protein